MSVALTEPATLISPLQPQVPKLNPRPLAFYLRLGFGHIGKNESHMQMEHWLRE